jgi:hypothetical protein
MRERRELRERGLNSGKLIDKERDWFVDSLEELSAAIRQLVDG